MDLSLLRTSLVLLAGASICGATGTAPGDLTSSLRQSPAIPTARQSVLIQAPVESGSPVEVELLLRLKGVDTFATVPMQMDGVQGERVFSASIPAQAAGAVVEYRVSSADEAASASSQSRDSVYRVNPAHSARVPVGAGQMTSVQILMTDANESLLRESLAEGRSTQVFASVVVAAPFETRAYPSATVQLGRGDAADEVQPLLVQLDSETTLDLRPNDPFTQVLGSALFRRAELSAPAAHPVSVQLGLGAGPQVYASLGDLTEREAGSLYRGDRDMFGVPAHFSWDGDNPHAYQDRFTREGGSPATSDWGDFIALVDALDRAPKATYYATVARVADLDQWARFFAVSTLLGHGDGLARGIGNNFYVAFTGPGGRARLIPENLDTLEQLAADAPELELMAAGRVPGLSRLFENSKFRTQYVSELRDVEENLLTEEVLEPLYEQAGNGFEAATITSSASIDAVPYGTDLEVGLRVTLDNEVLLDLPIVDGFASTPNAELTLTGTADVHTVHQVLVNGMPVDFNTLTGAWTTGTEDAVWTTVRPYESQWSYLDDNSDLDQEWIDPAFNDLPWARGDGPFGYGFPSQGTLIDFGGDTDNRYITTYFRGRLNNYDPNLYQALDVNVQFDDGIAMYFNGEEVMRDHLAPEYAAAYELAEVDVQGLLLDHRTTKRMRPDVLIPGTNVLAAEIHIYALNTNDMRFDMEILGQTTENPKLVLNPGINQIVVDYVNSAGKIIETDIEDVYYNTGNFTTYQGFNQGPITMTAAGGPYRLTNTTTFSGGLILEPGATLFFDEGGFETRIRVGELVAKGFREQRIWLGPTPGFATQSPSINSDIGTYLDFVDYQGGPTPMATYGFDVKRHLITRDSYFTGRRDDLFVLTDTSVLFRRNFIDAQFGNPPVDPQPDREYFEGIGDIGDYFIIEDNTFDLIAAKSDMIDTISGELPGPIMEVRGNTFLGSSDEVIDGNGDYLLDGNFVFNVFNPSASFSSNSNFISTEGSFRHYAVTRNVIVNCQHIVNNVNNTFTYLENNTIYNVLPDPNSASSPVTMRLGGSTPGLGAYLAGNIWDTLPTFVVGLPDNGQPMFIEVHNDMVQDATVFDNVLTHNVDFVIGDPEFVSIELDNFRLAPGSDGKGSGPFGLDHGAFVDRGVRFFGVPSGVSTSDSATITVGGPGMFRFIYRLDDEPWSSEVVIQDPMDTQNESKARTYDLELTGLSDGMHSVQFRGIDMASAYQPSITQTGVWIVQTAGNVSLNEVFAPRSAVTGERDTAGFVELANLGGEDAEFGGYSLTTSQGAEYVFPTDAVLEAGEYVSIPLALTNAGDRVELRDGNGGLVESVEFGYQGQGASLVKDPVAGTWHPASPTPGTDNGQPAQLGNAADLRISEWLLDGQRFDTFVELHNPTPYPIALADVTLTDSLLAPSRLSFAGNSFLGPNEYRAIPLEGLGAPLELSATQGEIALFARDGETESYEVIDAVFYGPQAPDTSEGLLDGAERGAFAPLPTPTPNAPQVHSEPIAVSLPDSSTDREQS